MQVEASPDFRETKSKRVLLKVIYYAELQAKHYLQCIICMYVCMLVYILFSLAEFCFLLEQPQGPE